MTARTKILHVETGTNLYGGALQVHYLLRGLMDHDAVKSALVCPEGSAISEAAAPHVHELYSVPMRGDLDLPFIPRLMGIIRETTPDIVHLHSRRGADTLGGIAARLTGTPCILTRRVDNPESRFWAAVKYRLYDRVIAISEGIRKVLTDEGVPDGKITCVRSAVDISLLRQPCDRSWFLEQFGLTENAITCGVVAQLIPRKGHRYLFEAVPDIVRTNENARFLIFGKGPLEEELRNLCRDLGIADKVIFAGFRDDLDQIMGCLDLLIHPALMEGLGVSLLQAAAAGVPIVGTLAGGIPEIVQDGVNGYLVPPGKVPPLADAAKRIIKDKYLAKQLGEAGRKVVEGNFSIRSMVEGNLEVYRSLMEKIGGSSDLSKLSADS